MRMPRVTAKSYPVFRSATLGGAESPNVTVTVEFDLGDGAQALRLLEAAVQDVKEQIWATQK